MRGAIVFRCRSHCTMADEMADERVAWLYLLKRRALRGASYRCPVLVTLNNGRRNIESVSWHYLLKVRECRRRERV